LRERRPNVIYILGDDQRAEYLGCAGHPTLRTPNLDQLAAEGTRFSNAFCTSPACTPSRTSHYLGQWERRHGINFNSGSSLDPRVNPDAAGQVRDEMVAVPDLAPTVMELCGLEAPDAMQGRSLRPLLEGESIHDWREQLFAEQLMDIQNYPRSESIRTRDWKYIRYFARAEDPAQAHRAFRGTLDDYNACLVSTLRDEQPVYEELFHLREDPAETTNLAADAGSAAMLDDLRAGLLRLAREAKGDDAPPLTIPFGA